MSAFRTAGGLMEIAAIHYRDAGNVLVDAGVSKSRNAANVLKPFYSAFSASLTTDAVTGYGNSSGSPTMTTPIVGAVLSGGVAPFTYLWTRTAADAQPWTIGDPTAFSTDFSSTIDTGATATFICTVTDSIGAVAVTPTVTASVSNLGGGA